MTTTLASPRSWMALVNPQTGRTHSMIYIKASQRSAPVEIAADAAPRSLPVHSFHTDFKAIQADHFLGAVVRVLKGPVPSGRLRVSVDQQVVILEPIHHLGELREPDQVPWAAKQDAALFMACEIDAENQVDLGKPLGYMLPGGSIVEAALDLDPVDAPASLEVELLFNRYESAQREVWVRGKAAVKKAAEDLTKEGALTWMSYVVKNRVCTGHPEKPGEDCGKTPAEQCSWHIVRNFRGEH